MELRFLSSYARYGTLVLRIGLAAVVLWFGAEQLSNASAWTIWVPDWATSFGLSAEQIVYLNGTFEIMAGILLVFGCVPALVALLLAAHLFLIAFEIGLDPTGVRDFGLGAALFALALLSSKKETI